MAEKESVGVSKSTTPGGTDRVGTGPGGIKPVDGHGEAPQETKKVPWFRFTVMILFGVVYVWDLFSAVSNLLGKLDELRQINAVRALNNFVLFETPWVPLIINLILPVVVFGLALWISRRRNVGILAIVLLAGLGVVAAISLSLTTYVLSLN